MNANIVKIFDTTLRDGEQSPGATLNIKDKLEIAKQLARLGVDCMEAGFPAASPGDLAAVQQIAALVGNEMRTNKHGKTVDPPVICGLARASKEDIDAAAKAVREAKRSRIHLFLATSPIHLKYKLKMTPKEALERAVEMVAYAKSLADEIEFSPEDAGRSEPEYLYEVLEAVIKAGADVLNIPDTVGYTIPTEYGSLIKGIIQNTPGIQNTVVSVHCHNDLGLATANSLAGIEAGARQAEVTINGIGERAGNTALEEIVMALFVRKERYDAETNIVTHEIHRTSVMVSQMTGMMVQPNKAIVGANAFAHEAGIHQDGVLKHQRTYEIMDAETIGLCSSNMVIGKHSGRHAFRKKITELGYELSAEQIEEAFKRFKDLADKKKNVADSDIEAIVQELLYEPVETWHLENVQVHCGMNSIPTAVVRLKNLTTGEVYTEAGFGQGPIDAIYQGVEKIVKIPTQLSEFIIQAVTEGIDAVADVSVRIRPLELPNGMIDAQGGNRKITFYGRGVDTDIVVASASAYLWALNKMIAWLDANTLPEKSS